MTRLVLWRHGNTDWNAQELFQGQSDIPLNATGVQQAEAAAPYLAALNPDALYSSPLQRAWRTAEALSRLTDLEITPAPGLIEVNCGEWEGLNYRELFSRESEFITARDAGVDRRFSETGESLSEVGQRVSAQLREIAAAHPGQTVVAASHGMAIQMGIAGLLGWDCAKVWLFLGGVSNCGWTVVEANHGRWRPHSYNNTAPC